MEAIKKTERQQAPSQNVVDKRIQKAIEESEKTLANNPKFVTLEEFYKEFDNV